MAVTRVDHVSVIVDGLDLVWLFVVLLVAMAARKTGKTRAQLGREIAEALRKKPRAKRTKANVKISHLTKQMSFLDLLRDDDPNSMQVAEDFVLERGWKMREMAGSLHGRNFTFDMKPLSGPKDQWKMVQVSVFEAGRAFPGYMTAEYSIANGGVRVKRSDQHANTPDAAKKSAVATAWAIAKAIKPLPMNSGQKAVEHIVDDVIDSGLDNLNPDELF